MNNAAGAPAGSMVPMQAAPSPPDDMNAVRPPSSRPPVALVEQTPELQDETSRLLRTRLRAALLVISVAVVYAFLYNLLHGFDALLPLRVGVLLLFVGGAALLSSPVRLCFKHLRAVEIVAFFALGVQVTAMTASSLLVAATQHDEAAAASVAIFNHFTWSMMILVYGIFMPNTWRRAALVLAPAAVAPYLTLYGLAWLNQGIDAVLARDHVALPLPMSILAAGAAVYAAHVVHVARREAFQARRFGQYRIGDKLGAGGMGEVYRAEHVLMKRPCAIKLIRPDQVDDPRVLVRFEREVHATARLSHWNSIEIYDYGKTADGVFYYVMELLEGRTLAEILEQFGALPASRAVHFLRQTCFALSEAHAAGLIHRDLKPANIFAAKIGGLYDVAKLLDFGLVRDDEPPDAALVTGITTVVGTPTYMSPEQALASHYAEATADIYSLGAVAYHLVTGAPPFRGESSTQVLLAHAQEAPEPPSRRLSGVPHDVEEVILRCLQKKPENRYATAAEVEQALAKCACADKWTQADAVAWWRKNVPELP